ncbi:aldo/keto reductase [Thalassotalea agarivorans]|uniref:Predicted oxidoreductase n=1 Tax=Thalassotalea agarivorans TaxID=349064 RepID=A0A1I0CCK6_THASX|nr:aldo/keto reductase [Thalassotalea agarivorans]SET17290.1 Predicted oxidoreductase [Thalassotalea agarivorans]
MQYSRLGSSNIKISRVCLGTMTWGEQNTQQDADSQLDFALDAGVNFIDTAEMYPVPPAAATAHKTEEIIGDYLARNPAKRNQLVLATKVAGPGLKWIRGGQTVDKQAVVDAVEASLKRLKVEAIDLYQIHWPNRTSPHFSRHWPGSYKFTDTSKDAEIAEMANILEGLQLCIEQGKIKHVGLSDETPWGIHTYLNLAKSLNLPKMVSIQNEFSALHTKDWPYLIETCVHEDVAYLPWSPLAGGALTGKYIDGARPKGSRWSMLQRNGLFRDTEQSNQAVVAFVELANQFAMSPAQLALAWCNHVNGVSSTIIGATTLAQLEENIAAFDLTLSSQQLDIIQQFLKQYPSPF